MSGRSAVAWGASLLGPRGSALRAWRLALGAALAVLLVWLAGPYTPWRLPGEQKLLPEPGQKLIYTVFAGLSTAAAVNALLCLVLLATSRRWAGDALVLPDVDEPRAPRVALLGAHDCLISAFTPYPGSELFEELRRDGTIPRIDDGYFEDLLLQFDATVDKSY